MESESTPPQPPAPPAGDTPPAPALDPSARLCGNCRFFTRVVEEAAGWRGDCMAMKDRGMFPETAPVCNRFLPRAAPIPRSLPPEKIPGEPRRRSSSAGITVRAPRPNPVIPELTDMTREELKDIIREAMFDTDTRIAPRFDGGKIVIKPADESLQAKELPVEALFHKVVMVRDRLRVLEQKVNAHPKLSDAEKAEMQQYVTRCYGSLTTFNILFADEGDKFAGTGGKE